MLTFYPLLRDVTNQEEKPQVGFSPPPSPRQKQRIDVLGDPFVPGFFSSPCSNRETEEMEELIFFHQLQSKVTNPKQRAQKGGEPGWLLG